MLRNRKTKLIMNIVKNVLTVRLNPIILAPVSNEKQLQQVFTSGRARDISDFVKKIKEINNK